MKQEAIELLTVVMRRSYKQKKQTKRNHFIEMVGTNQQPLLIEVADATLKFFGCINFNQNHESLCRGCEFMFMMIRLLLRETLLQKQPFLIHRCSFFRKASPPSIPSHLLFEHHPIVHAFPKCMLHHFSYHLLGFLLSLHLLFQYVIPTKQIHILSTTSFLLLLLLLLPPDTQYKHYVFWYS